jgi:hypothetical protein
MTSSPRGSRVLPPPAQAAAARYRRALYRAPGRTSPLSYA